MARITVRQWILAFREGKDLISDRDTNINFSGKLYDSMGGWKILPGGVVVMELRRTRYKGRPGVSCCRAVNYFNHVGHSILKYAGAEAWSLTDWLPSEGS